MPYEVQTPVFEGPFDLLLHLILREQVDLYEVSLATIVDAYLAELEPAGRDARPRRRHRVPAHRRHAGRAEGPPPPARARRHRPRRRAGPVGGAGPAPGPPARVQDVQGRGRCCSPRWPTAAGRSHPAHRRARGALPRPRARPARRASRPRDLRAAFLRAVTPKPVPRVDLDHVAPGPGQRRRRRRRAGRRAAPGRAHHFRRLTRRSSSARGRRAVPRRARAVQAGPGRPRPGRRPSATSTIVWLGGRPTTMRVGPRRRSRPASTSTTAERGTTSTTESGRAPSRRS